MNKKSVIFLDGDDTLWDTQRLYDQAISNASKAIRLEGIDVTSWHKALHEAEMELIPRYGFSKARFPTALVNAYKILCNQQGANSSVKISKKLHALGLQVFDEIAPLLPEATKTVEPGFPR